MVLVADGTWFRIQVVRVFSSLALVLQISWAHIAAAAIAASYVISVFTPGCLSVVLIGSYDFVQVSVYVFHMLCTVCVHTIFHGFINVLVYALDMFSL